jgi:hypothetical protein
VQFGDRYQRFGEREGAHFLVSSSWCFVLLTFDISFQPDYDDIEEENRLKPFASSRSRDKAKDNKKYGE